MTAPKDGARAHRSAPRTSLPCSRHPRRHRGDRTHLLGRDPRQLDRINDAMDDALVGHNHAKTALDVACWDIFGKSVGLPVCELLGGPTGVPHPTISSIYAGEPEEMRRRVADHRAKGYRGHSIKIGALDSEGGPALDAERIAACLATSAAANSSWSTPTVGCSRRPRCGCCGCSPGLDFVLEAPCATWRETMSLRNAAPTRSSSTNSPSKMPTSPSPWPTMLPTVSG